MAEPFEWRKWLDGYGVDAPSVLDAAEAARRRGAINKRELLRIAYWKSSRAAGTLSSNLRGTSAETFICKLPLTASDQELLNRLCCVRGVSVSVASAVLSLMYPERFAVTDWRARDELNRIKKGYQGVNSKTNYLDEYLPRVRELAQQHGLTPRKVDQALWARSRERSIERLIEG